MAFSPTSFPRKDTAGVSLVMWKITELRPQKGLKQTWKPLSWYLVNSPVKRKQLTMAAVWMFSGGDSHGSSEANAEGVG